MSPPRAVIARRLRELRTRRGWSAERLAEECAREGADGLNRSVIANIESGRRKYVTVDEALLLAWVLDVAPIHLLVPTEPDPEFESDYYLIGENVLPHAAAREWIRGRLAPASRDARVYYSEVPKEEWTTRQPTDEEVEERGRRTEAYRDMSQKLFPDAQRRWAEGEGDGDGEHQ